MDRMKASVCAAVVAMMMGFVWSASAQDGETTELVDWNDATTYAELMDTFVNDDGVLMATYYDEAQNVLWSQPASLKLEEAAAALSAGPEEAGILAITQWIVPTSLWLCYEDSGDCSTGHKWIGGGFHLDGIVGGDLAIFSAQNTDCLYEDIERVRATGSSNITDYCDAHYEGDYYNNSSSSWTIAASSWCINFSPYSYGLNEFGAVVDYDYDTTDSSPPVAQFVFFDRTGKEYISRIVLTRCGE